jgi:AcrR family transcriptional regulator
VVGDQTTARRPRKKRAGHYHHGDLRQALIDEALRTIDRYGPEALTLRGVAEALGVSRTAMYRHFSDKQALIAAVAREGFRALRLALSSAWEQSGHGRAGFTAMGEAYLQFAVTRASYYRVIFGRFDESPDKDPQLLEEAAAAFHVLVDALVEQQRDGIVRADDPVAQARFVWSVTHGLAMLTIDGQLREVTDQTTFIRYAIERLQTGIAVHPET